MIDTRNIYKLKIAEKEDVLNLIKKRLNILNRY